MRALRVYKRFRRESKMKVKIKKRVDALTRCYYDGIFPDRFLNDVIRHLAVSLSVGRGMLMHICTQSHRCAAKELLQAVRGITHSLVIAVERLECASCPSYTSEPRTQCQQAYLYIAFHYCYNASKGPYTVSSRLPGSQGQPRGQYQLPYPIMVAP